MQMIHFKKLEIIHLLSAAIRLIRQYVLLSKITGTSPLLMHNRTCPQQKMRLTVQLKRKKEMITQQNLMMRLLTPCLKKAQGMTRMVILDLMISSWRDGGAVGMVLPSTTIPSMP